MKLVKSTAEYSIFKRNDGRHAVRSSSRKWINGEDKVKILMAESLLAKPAPKPAEPEAAAEEASEEGTAE